MNWRSHLTIAERVGSELNFSKQELLKLSTGAIAPDKSYDHSLHHNQAYLERKIIERIIRARRLFLTHNTRYIFEIGVALHYIGDRLVSETTSYLRHINIEEEIAQISKSCEKSKHILMKEGYKKSLEEIEREIKKLEIREEQKTLLLDPSWTTGKQNALSLALVDLPHHAVSDELLLSIAFRISIGVAVSITSQTPPPQLLWEKYNFVNHAISLAVSKFVRHLIFIFVLPSVFLVYGKIGVVAYFLIQGLNLLVLIPNILILRKVNPPKNYLTFCEHSKSLCIFFFMGTLLAVALMLWGQLIAPWRIIWFSSVLPGVVLFLFTLVHLFYPKVVTDKEVNDAIDWYAWE